MRVHQWWSPSNSRSRISRSHRRGLSRVSGCGSSPNALAEATYVLMRVIAFATVFLICAWSQFCAAGGTNTVAIGGGNEHQVGSGFANRFSVPSKDEATAKLKSFRESGRAVTLREFLGGDIEFIRITFCDKPIDTLDRARALVKELLVSVVMSPEYRGAPMLDGPRWAEGTRATIRALVIFADGRVGRIHCDATDDGSRRAGGVHLFFEDHEGTYWWHRWDTYFPRKTQEPPIINKPD